MKKYIILSVSLSVVALVVSYFALIKTSREAEKPINEVVQSIDQNLISQSDGNAAMDTTTGDVYKTYGIDNDGKITKGLTSEKTSETVNTEIAKVDFPFNDGRELNWQFSYEQGMFRLYFRESVPMGSDVATTDRMWIYDDADKKLKVSAVPFRDWKLSNFETKFYGIGPADPRSETHTLMEYDPTTDSEKVFYTLPSGFSFTKSIGSGDFKTDSNTITLGVYSEKIPLHECFTWNIGGCLERTPAYVYTQFFGQ